MKKLYRLVVAVIATAMAVQVSAQQLPDSGFEDWSGEQFDGKIQLGKWNGSNVEQVGFKFGVIDRVQGRSGYAVQVSNVFAGAMGLGANVPGYLTLGKPWQYFAGSLATATGGTDGGIKFTYRPDYMRVWIKRGGDHTAEENYHLLFYMWKGTVRGSAYKSKSGGCTEEAHVNEESDVRQALDGNECVTASGATQVGEGWFYEKKEYGDWTEIVVPIYYMNDEVPEFCNVMFGSGNTPNFREQSGIYVPNTLIVDDVRLEYSSKISQIFFDNKEWKGFDPNSSDVQVCSVGSSGMPTNVQAVRGAGKLTNLRGKTVNFSGRHLSSSEMTIKSRGALDGDPMVIEVKAEDGSSTTTYKIQFVSKQSNNNRLAAITVNGEALSGFNPYITSYNVELPFGTTATPKVEFEKAEDSQTVSITQPTSTTGTATIKVTAQDGSQNTYTVKFSVAQLSDNTLADILLDGESLAGFSPTKRNYTVELPLGTTAAPKITYKSNYPNGAQTVQITNDLTAGAQISVTTPGNQKANVYKITYVITASTYSYLKDLTLDGVTITDFTPERTDYYVGLPMGTTALPKIGYTAGDKYQQTPKIEEGGLDGVTKITVTAAAGNQTIYRITFSVEKSTNTRLAGIYLDGKLLEDFDPDTYEYVVSLGMGATAAPKVTAKAGDDYQKIDIREGGLTGTTRIIVTAGDGKTTKSYSLSFTQTMSTVNTLKMIYVGGQPLAGFSANKLEYSYQLPQGTTTLPEVTYDKGDAAQSVNVRSFSGLTGDYKLVVKPQSGSTQTYVIHFSVQTSSNVNLQMIYVDGKQLEGFSASTNSYTVTLPMGTTKLPVLTWQTADNSQRVVYNEGSLNGSASTLLVRAEDGTTNTYSVSFVVPVAGVSTLLAITIDGTLVSGFDPQKTEYTINLPEGTTKLPAIGYTPNDEFQTIRKTEGGVNGDTRIVVRAQNGNTTTYILHFSVAKSSDVSLAAIMLGGKLLSRFSPERLEYDTVLPSSVTRVPSVTYTKGDPSQTVYVENGSFSSPTTLRVVAEDGSEQTYVIRFSQQHSENAYLKMIYLDGEPLADFRSEKLDYSYNLPLDATTCPVLTVDKEDGQRVSITMPALVGTASIVVEPEQGDKNIYTIRFTQAASTNSRLAAIMLDGVVLADFTPEQTNYTVTLAEGTTELPKISYQRADEYQTVFVTNGGFADKTYLKVIAADETSTVYTLSFITSAAEPSSDVELAGITIGGQPLAGFDPTLLSYTYKMTSAEVQAPQIGVVKGSEDQTIVISQPSEAGIALIEVTAADGMTQTYEIKIEASLSQNTALASIAVNGVPIDGFDAAQYHYDLTLPVGTTALPVITATPADNSEKVEVKVSSLYSAYIFVTAEDGTTVTYSLSFNIGKSDNSELAGINLGGAPLAGFAADVYEYEYELPRGTAQLPPVAVVKAYEAQRVVVDMPYREGKGTITVYAEDYTTDNQHKTVYTLNATAKMSDNAELEALRINGVNILAAGQFDYTIDVPAFSTPLADYTAGDEMQTIGFVDNGLKGVQVEVASEDGTQHNAYTVTYNEIPNDDATLKDLLVFNGTEFVSIFDINETTYTYPLVWRTRQVPAVWAVGNSKRQTIEINYGAVNETTVITVTAQDGIAQRVYKIDFPVDKSANVKLDEVTCDVADVMFDPDQFIYTIDLPYGTTEAPMLYYKKQEPEQQVIYTYAPLGEKSTIEVVAENGTKQTYEFEFNVAKSDLPNILDMVVVNAGDQSIPVTLGTASAAYVQLPFGTTEINVVVPAKNFAEQTVHIANGGAHNPTTIIVYPNRGSEAPKVYTLNPQIDNVYPTSLDAIFIDGTPLAGFSPDQYSYLMKIPAGGSAPTNITATAHNTAMLMETESTPKRFRIKISDETGITSYETKYYDIYFFYEGDNAFLTGFDTWENYHNTLEHGEFFIGNFSDVETEGVRPKYWETPLTARTTNVKNGLVSIGSNQLLGNYSPYDYARQSTDYSETAPNSIELTTSYIQTSADALPAAMSLSNQDVVIGAWVLEKQINDILVAIDKAQNGTILERIANAWALPFVLLKDDLELGLAATSPTALQFGQPIPYYNSPDEFYVDIKPVEYHRGIKCVKDGDNKDVEVESSLTGWHVLYKPNGAASFEYTGAYTNLGQWQTVHGSLPYVEDPRSLDIIICSANTENPADYYMSSFASTESNRPKGTIRVDNMRFAYRSDLTGLKVNGQDAALVGSDFSITLNGDDYFGKPELTFLRGVEDQQQTVTWNADFTQAQIVSTAEDCETTSNYTLTINRLPSTNNELLKLYIGGTEYTGFSPSTLTYTVSYDGERPDLQAVVKSIHAKANIVQTANATEIHVKPESGVEAVYIINWKKNTTVSSDAAFAATKIDGANAETETFFTITKSYDGQTIVFDETLGTIVCTASDGNATETISDLVAAGLKEVPAAATTYGVLTSITNDDMLLRDYDGENVFSYDGEQGMRFAFERKEAQDKVVETITDFKTTFTVTGTDGQKTYTINTLEEVNSNAALIDLLVNGKSLEGFYGDEDGNYTIFDLAAKIEPVIVEGQTVTITYTPGVPEKKNALGLKKAPKFQGDKKGEYTIHVLASDGIAEHTIKLTLGVQKSDKTELASLMVGDEVLDVNADPAQYTVTLTVPQPKTEETAMPSIVAVAGAEGQTIELEDNGVNATSYIIVTAENGSDQKQYDIEVLAAKSAYSKLDMLSVNGKSVTLTDGITDYNVTLDKLGTPAVEAQSDDKFVTITKTVSSTEATIAVEAEDGMSVTTYHLAFTLDASLSDPLLSNLTLGGKPLDEWEPFATFSANVFEYNIVLPCKTAALPVINAIKRYDAQTVSIITGGVNGQTIIDVVSPDGMESAQYRLNFSVALSSNCDLAGLSIDYEPLAGFAADKLTYDGLEIVNEAFLVQPVRGDAGQTVDVDMSVDGVVRVTVISEDLSCTKVYTLNYIIKKCTLSTLSNLLVDGNPLSDFEADKFQYVYTLPLGVKTVPGVTAVAGCDGQIITTDIREAGETSYITVQSEDLKSTSVYQIQFDLTLSDNCDLDAILENGSLLPGFSKDVNYYEFHIAVGEPRELPELTYLTSDENATVSKTEVYLTDYRRETRFYVTAENGTNKKTYCVVYNIDKSTVDYLKMIYVDDVEVEGFTPARTTYDIELEIGSSLPMSVTADKGDEYQKEPKVELLTSATDYAIYKVTATAESGAERVYMVNITIKKSTNLDLKQLTVDGLPIEVNGDGYTASSSFEPLQTEYQILWAVGTPADKLPVIGYQAGDSYQVITMSSPLTSTTGVVTITVQNQLGATRTYTVTSSQQHSDNDQLLMITLDGNDLEGFSGTQNTYTVTLPVGQTQFPAIDFEKAEQWQTVSGPTLVSQTVTSQTYEIRVVAEAGNQRTYTINLQQQLSDVDYLKMIYLGENEQPLEGFLSSVNKYKVTLPYGTQEVPKISFEKGDQWQQVTVTAGQLYAESYLLVMAQNGQTRTYSIFFDVEKSSESRLSMIYTDGEPLAGFDEDITDYTVMLPYGVEVLPKLTYDLKDENATVEKKREDRTVTLTVTAENGADQTVYTLTFENLKSDNALLESIRLDGTLIDEFDKEKFDYAIELPYGTTSLPAIDWTVGDEQQTVALEQTEESYVLIVKAGNGNTNEYHIDFTVALSGEARLEWLRVADELVPEWNSDQTIYHLEFPAGTEPTSLYTDKDITCKTLDADATYSVVMQEDQTITVMVTAPNGNLMVYVITQTILLSDNALLADLTLDGVTIAGFNPEVFEYEYELYEGQTAPEVLAVAQDELAEVSVTMGAIGELTQIYCTAQDGTEKIYTILFHVTDIDVNATPNEGSCYWEHIPGTMQYRAITICNNVQCAVFDFEGHQLMIQDVEKTDPNKVDIGYNQYGEQVIYSVATDAPATIFTMPTAEQTYFYVFLQNGKKILSGKFMLIR